MTPLLAAFTVVAGLIVGSFLNALLWRLHSGESVVRGRSKCTDCGHVLAARDLVPVVSWLLLAGRCRHCRKPISWSYPAIELAVAALFTAAAWRLFSEPQPAGTLLAFLLRDWYFIAILVTVFVFDLRHMLILRGVTTPAIVLALAANLALGAHHWVGLAFGLAFGGGIFWLQYVLSKGRWIGGGDIHLGLLMGAMLGWPYVAAAIFLAYVVGALYGVAVLATGNKTLKSEVPFGTFLSAAAVAVLLWGPELVAWYVGLIS